jgi:hypothetical protein
MQKQAVVLIHGIGEQKPMDALRSFVDAVLANEDENQETYWSKPDSMAELFELRRLQSRGRIKTHFFEYYWAYQVQGTKLLEVGSWMLELICRRSADVPRATKALFWLGRALAAGVIALAALGVVGKISTWFKAQPTFGIVSIAGALLVSVSQLFLLRYLGDAARYLSPRPRNIRLRQAIRRDGLTLLRKLHESREYSRIIVVGHSLGSVIGYDLITRLWQEYSALCPGLTLPETQQLIRACMAAGVNPQEVVRDQLSAAGEELSKSRSDSTVEDFRRLQKEAWQEQRTLGNPWCISDFVTLGSPLVHARLLLAKSRADFISRQKQRELPTCPPQRDEKGYAYSGSPTDVGDDKKFTPLVLHHAAPFAVTRWTNLYFPAKFGLLGDLVGGPLHEDFGPGILDVPVRTTALAGLAGLTPFAHTRYWRAEVKGEGGGKPTRDGLSLTAVKNAMNLRGLRDYKPRGWPQLHHPAQPEE